MNRKSTLLAAVVALPLLLACGRAADDGPVSDGAAAPAAGSRDVIRVVGSSTVYPFVTKVAEQFGRTTDFPAPVIESTGSGGGLKLFCAGVGTQYPDLANASRAIKASEIERCAENGIDRVTEIEIGYDGIVVANSNQAPAYELTRRQLFLALAQQVPDEGGELRPNPYRTWSEVDPSLPDRRIEVYGPPPTSGTRDAFVELVMEPGCSQIPALARLEEQDEGRFRQVCHALREDGAFVEAGENDNLIVQKLLSNPEALGIFGFSFLDQNRDRVQGATIDGAEPTFDSIADQEYPVSRPLFVYVKGAHVDSVPGIRELVAELVSDRAIGEDGYLVDLGLIPLPQEELETVRREALDLVDNVD